MPGSEAEVEAEAATAGSSDDVTDLMVSSTVLKAEARESKASDRIDSRAALTVGLFGSALVMLSSLAASFVMRSSPISMA